LRWRIKRNNIIIVHRVYACWWLIGQDLLLPTGYAALIPHTPEMTITPKKYAVMILPISGAMISIAALLAVIEDTVRFKRDTFRVAGDDMVS